MSSPKLRLKKGNSQAMSDPTRQVWLSLSRWRRVLSCIELIREQIEPNRGPQAETHKRQLQEDYNTIKKQVLREGESL